MLWPLNDFNGHMGPKSSKHRRAERFTMYPMHRMTSQTRPKVPTDGPVDVSLTKIKCNTLIHRRNCRKGYELGAVRVKGL